MDRRGQEALSCTRINTHICTLSTHTFTQAMRPHKGSHSILSWRGGAARHAVVASGICDIQ